MLRSMFVGNNYFSITTVTSTGSSRRRFAHFTSRAYLNNSPVLNDLDKSSLVHDSLRLLEWNKLCDSVASFAGTSSGKEATKAQLWSLNQTYEESKRLLDETNAAVEIHKYGGGVMDFSTIDIRLVNSAIEHARSSLPVDGSEAMAIVGLLQFAENLQFNLKVAIKEDEDWYQRFMPLGEMIMELVTNRPFIKFVQQLVDDDGSVKDSASAALKRSREQVRLLESKLYQLMDRLIRNKLTDVSALEVSNIDGRICLRLRGDSPANFEGLLLSSHSGCGSIVEPLSAVALNDELQQAKALVAKAEADVMLKITEKMQVDLNDIENLFNSIVQLDVEIRRRKLQGEYMSDETDINLSSLELRVTQLQQDLPIPVDIFIAQKTRVLVVTGPNAGGKTICLKSVGLAAVMAKSGLYVLSSESVKIPWFDSVFADIGDEQSLSQSLSTFSGHLRQISEILKYSTSQSLVLLDEVGAGTNPLEGAALGMSVLESFAKSGPLLTIATTHHGELKTLKYSNDAFENACMEFDDVNLKPTYRILWGVPGRSNAINIAERLGLPDAILDNARQLYGAASAEINEVILEMERFKQNTHEQVSEAQKYLKLSRDLHANLIASRQKVIDHGTDQQYRKIREITELASMARSTIHKKLRQLRASATHPSQSTVANNSGLKSTATSQHVAADSSKVSVATKATYSSDKAQQTPSEKKGKLPKVGDIVRISSLNKEATVLKVEPSKGQVFVQAGNMKLKLRLADVAT